MSMVMQTVSLCDELTVSLTHDGKIRVQTNLCYLPNDERNIAAKAAGAFFSKLGNNELGADIRIIKRIPVCAGMGGGSSDGAAVLRALNTLLGKPFSLTELQELGGTLGADIPFCVAGGTSLAEGKGEVLTELSPFPDCRFVIVKPKFSVSTPELFAKLDLSPVKYHPDTQGLLSALGKNDLKGVSQRMYNVFEDVLPKPDTVKKIKSALIDCGALGSIMTGTGSAVFGIFDNETSAINAQRKLSQHYREVFFSEPQNAVII